MSLQTFELKPELSSNKIANLIANPAVAIEDLLKQLGKKLWAVIKKKCFNFLLTEVSKIPGFKEKMDQIINYLMSQISTMLGKIKDNKIEIIMNTVLRIIENKISNDDIKIDLKIRPEANYHL